MAGSRLLKRLLLLGGGLAFALSTAGTARAAPVSDVFTLDVLTCNVFMPPIVAPDMAERAAQLSKPLKGHDVVLLQEAYSDGARETLLAGLAHDYPYQSRVLGRDSGFRQDGGVAIVSRWPIEREFQLPFGALCGGSDCLADKGVLYARINKAGRRAHVFATHLQSGGGNGAIRKKQLQRLRNLIDAMRLPANEPVLIGGDLNVDRLGDTSGGFAMLARVLDARHPDAPSNEPHRPTFDPAHNTLASGGKRAKYLDYVLYSERHLRPFMAFNRVRELAAAGESLSDHFAVHGRFVFETPAPKTRASTFPVVELLEGSDPRNDFLCNLSLRSGRDILVDGRRSCAGDTKSAFRLSDVPAGHVIRMYESARGSRSEDWLEITAKRPIASRRFDSLEKTVEDADVRVRYHGEDGFNGQISRVEVRTAPAIAERRDAAGGQ
jgi:endonuclease/exonuclease/phosphatase family metal-dependent hydrolase